MSRSNQFSLTGWRVILADLGINTTNVLRRAGQPEDLLSHDDARLPTEAYMRLIRAVDEEAKDPLLPLHLAQAVSVEAFDPAVFAACCSPNFNAAIDRLATYKPLICPMKLDRMRDGVTLTIEPHWIEAPKHVPPTLALVELLFFVALIRMGTRAQVVPLLLEVLEPPDDQTEYIKHLGIRVGRSDIPRVRFAMDDADRPFLVANENMWNFFEPELRRRLEQLEAESTNADRVRAALLECLPSGRSSADAVAKKLGMSKRTLQRRLQAEDRNFQSILDHTREELAGHYLGSSSMSGAEISFMLGYEDPNSFFRAFHGWTGQTPETIRN